MFPHTITIYTHSIRGGADVYERQTLSGFYYNEAVALESNNKGNAAIGAVTVISSPETAAAYGTGWHIAVGDYLVKGESGDISSIKELASAHKVSSVQVNIAGSAVDNIAVSCK